MILVIYTLCSHGVDTLLDYVFCLFVYFDIKDLSSCIDVVHTMLVYSILCCILLYF